VEEASVGSTIRNQSGPRDCDAVFLMQNGGGCAIRNAKLTLCCHEHRAMPDKF
jgi:hypothetical protein